MISLNERDELIIQTPRRSVVWEGEEPLRILGLTLLWRQVRRRFDLRALPLGELIDIENRLAIEGKIGLAEQVRVLVGRRADRAPFFVHQAIIDAHLEANSPPKAKTSPQVSPSPTAPSSADFAPTTGGPSHKSPESRAVFGTASSEASPAPSA